MSEEKLSWKNVGGSSFRMANGRIIKPNQTFDAYAYEIPKAHRDIIIQVGGTLSASEQETEILKKVKKQSYEIVPSETKPGLFDIVSGTGKKMNARPIGEPKAKKLLEDLQNEEE